MPNKQNVLLCPASFSLLRYVKAEPCPVKLMSTGTFARTRKGSKVGLTCQALDASRVKPSPFHTQTQGLGTALKILFSENLIEKIPESGPSYGFQLTRQEIVALFNAFGRLV